MSENAKRLFIAIFISALFHTSIFATYKYIFLSSDNDIKFSNDNENGSAFSLDFVQIATNNTNKDLSASEQVINEHVSYVEAMQDEKIEESVQRLENLDTLQENSEIIATKKEKKKKKNIKKAKKCLDCQNKNNTTQNVKSSIAKGANDANNDGGNRASGTKQNASGGTNITGLIYKAILKHKTYPKKAQIMRVKGSVKVSFKLIDKNNFEYLKVSKSSGFEMLDKHALKIIDKAKADFPIEAIGADINVSINFNLEGVE